VANLRSHYSEGSVLDRFAAQRQVEDLFRLADEGATELILVRHGEPASPNPNRLPTDDPMLSCTGLVQSERLAERLQPLWISSVYTAPERRAHQTAVVLSEATERPVITLGGLSDIEFEAQSVLKECRGSYGGLFIDRPRWDALPGFGEGSAFRRRAIETLESIVAAHPGERAIVVTHASVINAFLSMLLEVPRDMFFAPDHTSVNVVRASGDLQAVRVLNDTSHLESLLCGW
jgi:probable phosphoglycerate mutase